MTIETQLRHARHAAKDLLKLSDQEINETLIAVADNIEANADKILAANSIDLTRMEPDNPKYDRLKLTHDRITGIAADTREVAKLPSPRREIESRTRPNGLLVRRVAVPFGVIGIIYEARPNVTLDVFSLCFKSGNACVLKGGHDAENSIAAIVDVIKATLQSRGINPNAITLLPATHDASDELLSARGLVDLIIPRGSAALINSVRQKAQVPVIETGAGVCHCYIDSSANIDMAAAIVNNAKTRRVSVCNALDCMICHCEHLQDLPRICAPLAQSNVVIYADPLSYSALSGNYPQELLCHADDNDFGTEFLGYSMAIKTVGSIDQALAHIEKYGSGHSESIVTDASANAQRFQTEVDAACVYVNAPTSFTDGAQLGLGAEIGISTQKLHARGPMGLEDLMTYKWLIDGQGQVRPK